jgi:ABC-2 type transport system permease protein
MRKLWLNIRLFFLGALLSYIALFRWMRPVTYLASKVAFPMGQILFFSLLGSFASGGKNVSFYVIGNAIQIVAVSGIFGVTMSIGGDRWDGTLLYLFGTPANRLAMFVGRAFIHVIDGMLGAVIGLAWGMLVLGLDLSHADLPALALTILVATISTSGLGLLLGCMSLITLNVMFINNTMYFLLLIFSGANLDITTLPAWMQTISQVLPLTRSIAAARRVIAGESLASVAPLLAAELLIGIVYITLGYVLFRWFEVQAKRRDTLERI